MPSYAPDIPVATALFAAMMVMVSSQPTPAAAAANDGVRCPNGYETQFDAGKKVLRCERTTLTFRPTVCDPAAPEHIVYRVVRGRDYCLRPVDAAGGAASMAEGDPRRRNAVCTSDDADGLRWQLETDASAGERDRCRAARVEWIYPSQQ